jgi:peptide deformylase
MSKELKNTIQTFLSVIDAFPEFRYIGDPTLRSATENATLEEGREVGEKLGKVLIAYRKKVGYGRGLAAPQIGIGKRVFTTFVDDQIQIYINPCITERSPETNFYRELCLSSGIMWADIERSESITMSWMDVDGNHHEQTVDGFKARLWQHEEGHLNGEVSLDIAVPGTIEIISSDPLLEKLRSERL